jgi:hypothetical protein
LALTLLEAHRKKRNASGCDYGSRMTSCGLVDITVSGNRGAVHLGSDCALHLNSGASFDINRAVPSMFLEMGL